MKIFDVVEKLGAKTITEGVDMDREISGVYCCDLLSWVMSHAKRGNCWITVQTHINTVAVASLLELPCVIVPENIEVEEATIKKAQEENIAILSTDLDAFAISSIIAKAMGK